MGVPETDISGRRYGKLRAVRFVRTEKRITKSSGRAIWYNYWEFECDCGKRKVIRKGCVTSGKSSTRSCGCSRNRNKWKGYGEISGSYWGHIQRMAKRRGRAFQITLEYIWELFQKQDGRCALTGQLLSFKKRNQSASLDRIDSAVGYVPGNVQWVHKDINWLKQDFSDPEFISKCRLVVEWADRIVRGD